MILPDEIKMLCPVSLSNGVFSDTAKVWSILKAAKEGNTASVKSLAAECPELIYAQYNYTPPIHFAVPEGHVELVKYLLTDAGAK